MDTSRHRPFRLSPPRSRERGDSIAENGPARLMMAHPLSLLLRRMDILPPGERGIEGEGEGAKSEHGNGVEGEGSYGRGKRKLEKKGLLACVPSFRPDRLCCLPCSFPVHSLTHSLSRSVSCFRAFQDAHTLTLPLPLPRPQLYGALAEITKNGEREDAPSWLIGSNNWIFVISHYDIMRAHISPTCALHFL